jgi:Erv1 / Alr family
MLIDSGIVLRKTRTFTPLEAANTLRRYMDHFYICTECSRNFIADYDNCEHRLCDRLTDDASTASDADWKELGNWLWEFHNDVSLRVLAESRKKNAGAKVSRFGRSAQDTTATSVNDEIAALWPSLDMCIKCFNEDGSWNEDAVFLYLEHTYWPGATLDSKASRLLEFDAEIDPEGTGLFKMLLIGLLGLLIAMWRTISTQGGLQQTVLLAKRMAPKGAGTAKKRSL